MENLKYTLLTATALVTACNWSPATVGMDETPDFAGITEEPAILPAWGDVPTALEAEITGQDGLDHGTVTFMPEQDGQLVAHVALHNLDPREEYQVGIHEAARCGEDGFGAAGPRAWLMMEPAPRRTTEGVTRAEMAEPRYIQPDPDGTLTIDERIPYGVAAMDDRALVVSRADTSERIACGIIDPSA